MRLRYSVGCGKKNIKRLVPIPGIVCKKGKLDKEE